MKQRISNLQIALFLVSVALLGVLILLNGWQFYATITERPGFRGDFHSYLDLSQEQYASYLGAEILISLLFMIVESKYIFQQKSKQLNRTFIWSLIFLLLVVLSECYLDSRFTPKG